LPIVEAISRVNGGAKLSADFSSYSTFADGSDSFDHYFKLGKYRVIEVQLIDSRQVTPTYRRRFARGSILNLEVLAQQRDHMQIGFKAQFCPPVRRNTMERNAWL